MSQNNPQDLDIQEIVREELGLILNHVGGRLGQEIGELQAQLNNLAGLDLAQVTALQAQVQALHAVLDGDPSLPGFQNLTNLLALIDRVVALEGWQGVVDGRLTNVEEAVANVDDRLGALEGSTTQQLADIAIDVAAATSTAGNALSTANAAQAAVSVLADREDGRHNEHGNAIGKLRTQVYLSHAGLAAVTIAGFTGAFNSAKASAL